MPRKSKLQNVKDLLASALDAIASARDILETIEVGKGKEENTEKVSISEGVDLAPPTVEDGLKIIEGVFNGQNMVGSDKRIYPVPANYASKSKLIPGDKLKLTITETGAFKYKQIGPIPRVQAVGTVTYSDGQYHVMVDTKLYKVLLASITYYRAEVGSKVTVIVPQEGDSDWCAIEHLLPE